MSLNTIEENRRQNLFQEGEEVWLFGYGSLIYKVDFPFLESKPASIAGWSRKFWQGSHDHRGTEQNPGRVATLVEDENATCGGLAFKVVSAVFNHLDEREKNGYLRILTDLTFKDGSIEKGVVYIASPDNEAFLGEASEYDIAKQICQARGPSGPNCEYLLELAKALRELELEDEHVFELEHCVKKIRDPKFNA
jgi:cation transport regulator ChaC